MTKPLRARINCIPRRRPLAAIGCGQDGFVLVAVLWILAALAGLASVYAIYIGNTAMAARSHGYRVQARALVASTLELTAFRLIAANDIQRPTSGAFTAEVGKLPVSAAFRSEGARIDLNFAPKELLSGLFTVLGASPEDADAYADRIIAWRSNPQAANQPAGTQPPANQPADNPPNGSQPSGLDPSGGLSFSEKNPGAEAYSAAGLNYGPRQAPFQSTAELRLVLGLPAGLVDAVLPFVTVFNGKAEIDINEAAPQVIAALPKISPDTVAEILRVRDPRNPQAALQLLGAAQTYAAAGGRRAARVWSQVTLESGRKVNAEAVLLITDNAPQPYRILAFQDDFDGSLEVQPQPGPGPQ